MTLHSVLQFALYTLRLATDFKDKDASVVYRILVHGVNRCMAQLYRSKSAH